MMRIRTLTVAAAALVLAGCATDDIDGGRTASDPGLPARSSSTAPDAGPRPSRAVVKPPAATPAGGSGVTGDRDGGASRPAREPAGNEPPAVRCGRGYDELTVWAVGADCATARAVQAAFATHRGGGAHVPVKVYTAGHGWACYNDDTRTWSWNAPHRREARYDSPDETPAAATRRGHDGATFTAVSGVDVVLGSRLRT